MYENSLELQRKYNGGTEFFRLNFAKFLAGRRSWVMKF